jgi:hypothetical protein
MTTSFKRLAIGQTFTAKGGKFRKITPRLVFRIKEDGRGQTNTKIPFCKNTTVSV